jgi:hypothetical protein
MEIKLSSYSLFYEMCPTCFEGMKVLVTFSSLFPVSLLIAWMVKLNTAAKLDLKTWFRSQSKNLNMSLIMLMNSHSLTLPLSRASIIASLKSLVRGPPA